MIATKAKSRKLEVRKCDCMRAFKCSEISLRCIIKRNHILKMNSMERKRSYREKYGESFCPQNVLFKRQIVVIQSASAG